MKEFKPTKEDLIDAVNRKVPDIIKSDLKVLFVGINPGIYTAAVGKHFAHPANRFWKALYNGGFTPWQFSPFENTELLKLGLGISNIVERPTLKAEELTKEELVKGWEGLVEKVKKYKPEWVAICGISAYRTLFNRSAQVGEQRETINGTKIWLLPNPSGLSASFTPVRLAEIFSDFRLKSVDNCPLVGPNLTDNQYLELISAAVFQSVIGPEAAVKRWPDIKKAFFNFDVDLVSKMGEKEIEELLKNERMIKNRKKIEATIKNSQAVKVITGEYGSFRNYLNKHATKEELINDLSKKIYYIGNPSVQWILHCIKFKELDL